LAKEGNNAVAVATVDLSVVAAPVDHQEEVIVASTTTIVARARLLKIQKTIGPGVRYVTRKDIQQRSVGTGLKKTMCQIQS
jgi:outer membrane cobalamin receptor